MKTSRQAPQDIDAYIADFPPEVQKKLAQVRKTIRKAAPGATEAIKYGIPTFVLHENLVHFGGFKQHIGFYPTASGIAAFAEELAAYKKATGSVQFPLDEPLPLKLIEKMVEYRVAEATAKAAGKKKK